MPKSTHFHQVRDTMGTDKKNRPEDEGIYEQEKHQLTGSEKDKEAKPRSEEEFIAEQDEDNANGDQDKS